MICFFDLRLACAVADTEDLVEVDLFGVVHCLVSVVHANANTVAVILFPLVHRMVCVCELVRTMEVCTRISATGGENTSD